ncbi:hypothetical protein DYB36_005361 [Aphanomyces astaci]|uniref:Importin N-terminal domain-containing protein n=1 Tax=Aphanomyces astaci TaxID=112090 RepID=A0A397BP92_APHAT|nr:hypothetical protein DYB36_005361 [Aphanomyces astaci]
MGMEAAADSTLNVRVRVVWAIGNACTTPGPDAPDAPDSPWLVRLLPPATIDQVLQCMLHLVEDNDKVASSVVRTLGLLARWLMAPQYLEAASSNLTTNAGDEGGGANSTLLADAMTVLAKKVVDGAPKVRWNACHAMAKVFHCPELPLASVSWTPAVFTALTTAIAQQDNFKLSFTLVHLVALVQSPADEVALGEMLCRKYKDFIYDWLYHQQHKMYAAIFGDEVAAAADEGDGGGGGGSAEDGHEINPVTCAQVVDACDVLRRVIQQYCPHTASCLAQIAEVKLIFEMDMLDAIGFEF